MVGQKKYTKWLMTVSTLGMKRQEVKHGIDEMMKAAGIKDYIIHTTHTRAIVRCKSKDHVEYETKLLYKMAYVVIPNYIQQVYGNKEECNHTYAEIVNLDTNEVTGHKCINCGCRIEVE